MYVDGWMDEGVRNVYICTYIMSCVYNRKKNK